MTGLDDKTCAVIEMAMIVTDGELNELALVEQCVRAVNYYGYDSKIMFSSVRTVEHVRNAVEIGVHTITVPWNFAGVEPQDWTMYHCNGSVLKKGIRVNAVAPGPVWTPLNPADKSAKRVAQFGADTPMKRPAQPEEIAPAFVFLAAPSCSSYITGEVLPIIGGYSGG